MSRKNTTTTTTAAKAATAAVEATVETEPQVVETETVEPDLADDVTAGDELVLDEEDVDEEDLSSEDSLTFSNGVIEKIVALAVRDVPGVLGMRGGFLNRVQEAIGASDPTKGVTVEVTPDNSVRVNVSVLIEYGTYAPQVFEDVKRAVVKHITGMTGLEVGGVNLRIEDVLTTEEFNAGKRAVAEADAADVDAQTAQAE